MLLIKSPLLYNEFKFYKEGEINLKKILSFLVVCVSLFISMPIVASAVAGGGDATYYDGGNSYNGNYTNYSDNSSDGELSAGAAILLIIGYGISYLFKSNQKNNDGTIEHAISKRIEEAFCSIQNAWTKDKLELARSYYSQDLYLDHQRMLVKMRKENLRNYVLNVRVKKMHHFKMIEKDRKFSVKIEASLIDYTVDTVTDKLIRGRRYEKGMISQTWIFIKDIKNEWVVVSIR